MDSTSTGRRLLPFPEARHVLGGVGRTTVYDLIERDELTKVNIGRRSFITSDSLDAYMDRLAARPADDGAADDGAADDGAADDGAADDGADAAEAV